MSAIIHHPAHILTLAGFAVDQDVSLSDLIDAKRDTFELGGQVAEVLYLENIRSVQARYPQSNELPGPVDRPDSLIDAFRLAHLDAWRAIGPVGVIKAVQSLEYQSCETADWPQTTAAQICQRIMHKAATLLPGYKQADWSITDTVRIGEYEHIPGSQPAPDVIKAARELADHTPQQAAATVHRPSGRDWLQWEAGAPMDPAIFALYLSRVRPD